MDIVVEVIIAIVSLLASTALSYKQMNDQRIKDARTNFVRNMYQAVINRYGLSIQQLNQVAEKMGINLANLDESTRGSARLSTASKIARDYVQRYATNRNAINKTINTITNEINQLTESQERRASTLIGGGSVDNRDISTELNNSINEINTALSDFNEGKTGSVETQTIDTGLVDEGLKHDPGDVTPVVGYNPLASMNVSH